MTSTDDPDDQPQPIDPILLPDAVHQAIGMVSVQLHVDTTTAFDHIRAYAAAHQEDLEEVADDVIDRRLNFAAK
jgi:hypothetical protein